MAWIASMQSAVMSIHAHFDWNEKKRKRDAEKWEAFSYEQWQHTSYNTSYLPTYTYTYLPTHIHTYLHAYIPTYILPTYLHTYIHTYLRTYIPTYIHTSYLLACIHACIPTYLHTYRNSGQVENDNPFGMISIPKTKETEIFFFGAKHFFLARTPQIWREHHTVAHTRTLHFTWAALRVATSCGMLITEYGRFNPEQK